MGYQKRASSLNSKQKEEFNYKVAHDTDEVYMIMTYKIIARTDGWTANRDRLFKGKTEITLESGLTLKQAHRRLLEMFNESYCDTYATNWGIAVCLTHGKVYGACSTFSDGTRMYSYDGRYYKIEEER